MGSPDRRTASDLMAGTLSRIVKARDNESSRQPGLLRELLEKGHSFSYFQVLRLLRLITRTRDKKGKMRSLDEIVKIRPRLSLAFPAADVDRVEETDDEQGPGFMATVNFLGLYGTSSPLPTFYTEDLMDEASMDESVAREFIDIVNYRLFQLLFKSMMKYNQFLQVAEERNEAHLERLFCLLGLGEIELRNDVPRAYELIRYVGLFTQFPRSALGLKTLLRDAMGGVLLEVLPCVHRKCKIPEDQRVRFGGSVGTLGKDCVVGEQIEDRMGKFRIRVGPVTADRFAKFFPDGKLFRKLTSLTRLYVVEPLEFDVEVVLAAGEARPICLGASEWSRLGWDTFSFSGDTLGEVSVRFYPGF